uniref:Uncharacterized protein n=1 Tax=Glossina austeni TaxID=7395 RepID=A0A1A9V124_GLOAU
MLQTSNDTDSRTFMKTLYLTVCTRSSPPRGQHTSLEFAQYLHINLRHNQLISVKAIKWLPNLKTLDLSFNRLTHIPQFHMDAYKRLQTLNMSNNLVEELTAIAR